MLDGKKALAIAMKYTDDALRGMGVLAGAPCQIQSIVPITGGDRITFLWVDNEGDSHTQTLDVMDGVDGTTCQYEVLPEANATRVGMIAQYIGATSTYVNGYFYKCVDNGDSTYAWVPIKTQNDATLQPKTMSSSVTVGGQAQITVEGAISALASQDDGWTATAQVDSNSTVTFTGLNDSLAYALYVEDKLATITSVTKTGSGTSVTLAYVLSGVSAGDYCKLRIVR